MATPKQEVNPVLQNQMARNQLLQTALPIRKKIGTFTGNALGETLRVKLLNVGLTTNIQARVSTTVTTTGSGVVSPIGGFALVPQVVMTDYNQIERVSTDAYSLQALRSFKRRRLDDAWSPSAVFENSQSEPAVSQVPTGVVAGANLNFFIDIPLAMDYEAGDLRGLSLSQAVVGEQFVSFKFADTIVGSDPTRNVFTTATTAVVASDIVVEVWQEYLQPQSMDSLPFMDLSTIYEIKGLFRSDSDIATSGQKLINYPNVRTVFSSLHNCFDFGSAMTTTEINSLQLLVNSSQILREDTYISKKRAMVDAVLGEVGTQAIYNDHRMNPISTAIFGNVQFALNFAAITGGANTFIQSQFESLYASGTPLPGISTQ
jgi:hypothetical protein